MSTTDTGDFASKRAIAEYRFPFTPTIPDLDVRFSTNTAMFVPRDQPIDDLIPGVVPDYPMSDRLSKVLNDRSRVLGKVPPKESPFFPEVYAKGTGDHKWTEVPTKYRTAAMAELFSDRFITQTIKRVQLSLFKIMDQKPGAFVPPPLHRADVLAFLEDEYQNVGINVDNTMHDASAKNVSRVVYLISKPAIERMIWYGFRFLQDRSMYLSQQSGPYVMSHGEDTSVFGSRETIDDDTVYFRKPVIIQPDSMEIPHWWV